MAIDSTKKSSRFLQGRRYTHDTFTDAQEAFTSVLDINTNEVYTDQALIPSSSLPFSGSAQNGSIYSVGGQNVMKYWYRQKMTKSNLNNEVWFFLNPTGSASGIGAQLIDTNQQVNFLSPKYSVSSLSNANTEDTPPGYGVKVLVDATQQSTNNYAFDYKTGVLEFSSSAVAPTEGQLVYITAYQYVGRTLSNYTSSLATSASYALTASYALFAANGGGSSNTNQIATGSITASVDISPNNLFLIKSGSNVYFNISSSSNITLSSNLFIIKNFTTQQPVLTVSQSGIVTLATQSIDPTGTAPNGAIYFTSSSLFLGLD